MKFLCRSCIWACVGCVVAMGAWGGPNVLLLWDDDEGTLVPDGLNPHTRALIAAMEAAGLHVTLPAHTQGKYTGNSPALEDFDVLVHLNGGTSLSYVLPSSTANRLVFHVQSNHGGYVGSENNAAQMAVPVAMGGLSETMWDLTPIDRSEGRADEAITVSAIAGQEGHPVLNGVPAAFSFFGSYKMGQLKDYATNPATALMMDGNGNVAVAAREFGSGRVVGFHHGGNCSGAPILSDPNIQRLYINAVLWADQTAPSVAAIFRADANPTQADILRFTVRFSEGVEGLVPGDFTVAVTGDVQYDPALTLSAVSDREYMLQVGGVTGNGSLGLSLVDHDTIHDQSANANVLGGAGVSNGDFTGETYDVDRQSPALSEFNSDLMLVPLGGIPNFELIFDENMNWSPCPTVTVTTASNTVIAASSLDESGNGAWHNARTYRVALDRAIRAEDEGVATITVSGAKDTIGNVMAADTSHQIFLVKTGLRIVSSPPLMVYADVGGEHEFVVEIADAYGTVEYEWFREGAGKDFVPVGGNTSVLRVGPLTVEDSGTYYCVISDAYSSVQTPPTILSVMAALPIGAWPVLAGLAGMAGFIGLRRLRRR